MIDLREDHRSPVDTAEVADPAAIRVHGRRRRRLAVVTGVLVVVVAITFAVLALRSDSTDKLRVGQPESRPRFEGNDLRVPLADVPQGVSSHHLGDYRFFITRDEDTLTTFVDDARHLPGETLWWCPSERHFVALPHEETFASDGGKLGGGPARRGLDRYVTTRDGTDVVIDVARREPGAFGIVGYVAPNEYHSEVPWNSGPGSYCNNALTTNGPAPTWSPPIIEP